MRFVLLGKSLEQEHACALMQAIQACSEVHFVKQGCNGLHALWAGMYSPYNLHFLRWFAAARSMRSGNDTLPHMHLREQNHAHCACY